MYKNTASLKSSGMYQKPAKAAVIPKCLIAYTAKVEAQSETDKIVHALIKEKIGAVTKQ